MRTGRAFSCLPAFGRLRGRVRGDQRADRLSDSRVELGETDDALGSPSTTCADASSPRLVSVLGLGNQKARSSRPFLPVESEESFGRAPSLTGSAGPGALIFAMLR